MKKITFLFPGQGSQSVGMGQDIYQEFDYVREVFDMAEETSKINLSKLCFKGPMEELTETVNLQPAITTINLSLLAVLENESVKPDFCAGHSLGEYSALCAAGVISKEDTIRIVHKRGRLMHREATKHEGIMRAILGLDIDVVTEITAEAQSEGIVSIANHNSESQIVITGSPAAVEKASLLAAAKKGKTVPLKVSGAWHSRLMEGAEKEFADFLSTIDFKPPESKIVLNVTGAFEAAPEDIQSIMARQLGSSVKWYDSMKRLEAETPDVFAEIGPGKVLTGLLKKILPKDAGYAAFNVFDLKTLEQFLAAK